MELPDFVPHTNVQPLREAIDDLVRFYLGESFQLAELLVGDEITVFVRDGVVGIGTDVGTFPAGSGEHLTAFWFQDSGLSDRLVEFEAHVNKPFVIQGYMIGPHHKGNYYELEADKFVVSNIIDLNERYQLSVKEVAWFVKTFNENPAVLEKLDVVPNTIYDIPFAPAARKIALEGGTEQVIDQVKADLQDDFAVIAGGVSTLYPTKNRAGLVFRAMGIEFVFKVEKEVV